MTRRERLERKLEKRRAWAQGRRSSSEQRWGAADAILAPIPLGQPVLVGHHSERRHRRALERADANMSAAVADSKMAAHHDSKADGLERQLEGSIFSDDPDAVEALEARIQELTAEQDRRKRINAAFRKVAGEPVERLAALVQAGVIGQAEASELSRFFAICHYERQPFPPYSLTNLGARIRTARERIKLVQARAARAEQAEAAGGVHISGGDYVSVTFAEKPARELLDKLKAARFYWRQGSWFGARKDLPAELVS